VRHDLKMAAPEKESVIRKGLKHEEKRIGSKGKERGKGEGSIKQRLRGSHVNEKANRKTWRVQITSHRGGETKHRRRIQGEITIGGGLSNLLKRGGLKEL